MGIPHGRVCQQHLLLIFYPVDKPPCTLKIKDLLGPAQLTRTNTVDFGHLGDIILQLYSHRLVDHDIAEKFQNPAFIIRLMGERGQVRILLDETGMAFSIQKLWVIENVDQKSDIGLDSCNLRLGYRSNGFLDGILETPGPGDVLDEEAVIIRTDFSSSESVAAVQPDPEARAGPV